MFDIGWTEMLMVAVVMILVVGPKDLPRMLRTFGKTMGNLRRMASDFQGQFNDALREAEQQAGLDETKKSLSGLADINPVKDLKKSMESMADIDLDEPEDGDTSKAGAQSTKTSANGTSTAGDTANGAAPTEPAAETDSHSATGQDVNAPAKTVAGAASTSAQDRPDGA
ncbi:MAG: Sec-independent protein translocase protein TatB [Pseudomonadota bacterium]